APFGGAACRVTGTHASRRSTAAIFYTATALLGLDRRDFPSRYPGGICAAVHPDPSSHLRQTPRRGRAVTAPPGTRLRTSPAGAAIPAPPPNASGRRPQ